MKITFLGTGTSQGVPVIACPCGVCHSADERDRRLRTSALIEVSDKRILIDIGPDFRQQMLRNRVTSLDAILITHAHRDHVAGIDDIRAFNYVQQGPMQLYLNAPAQETLLRDYHYIFAPHDYPGLPEANLHEIDGEFSFVPVPGIEVIPIKVMHKNLPILGYRIGDLAYITDANYIEPKEMKKLQGVRLLVLNALRREKHWSHYCLPEALDIIEKVKPEQAFLTHISHELGLHDIVEKELPEGVHLAYDNLSVEI